MSEESIQNPHDQLFKEAFSHTENAVGFFQNYLPPVLPLVLFQGGATWTADLSLSGLIDIPDGLALYQPEFRHLLVDLNHINADELKGTLIVRTCLLALKAR